MALVFPFHSAHDVHCDVSDKRQTSAFEYYGERGMMV